jgi:hypothetical protein
MSLFLLFPNFSPFVKISKLLFCQTWIDHIDSYHFPNSPSKMVHFRFFVLASLSAFALAIPQVERPLIPTGPEYYLQTKVISGDASKNGLYGRIQPNAAPTNVTYNGPQSPFTMLTHPRTTQH